MPGPNLSHDHQPGEKGDDDTHDGDTQGVARRAARAAQGGEGAHAAQRRGGGAAAGAARGSARQKVLVPDPRGGRLAGQPPSVTPLPEPVAQNAALAGTDVATYTRERPGMSAFVLEDGAVYHTYSTYARGLDGLWGMYQWLDRAPRGRNETGVWWRRHDEYDKR